MRFLIIVLACLLRRQLDARRRLDCHSFLRALFARLGANHPSPGWGWGIMAIILASGALVGAFDYVIAHNPLFFLWVPVELALLVMLMGNPGWHGTLRAYGESWQRGDTQAAWHHVRHLLPPERQGQAISPEKLHVVLVSRLLLTAFEGYFLMIFWYALLGPAGALIARLSLGVRDHWPAATVRATFAGFCEILAWIPARLLSATFGLAGDFSGWLTYRRAQGGMTREAPETVLFGAANGALSSFSLEPKRFAERHPEEWPEFGRRSLLAVRDLLNRSMLVWIALLALLAIGGWL